MKVLPNELQSLIISHLKGASLRACLLVDKTTNKTVGAYLAKLDVAALIHKRMWRLLMARPLTKAEVLRTAEKNIMFTATMLRNTVLDRDDILTMISHMERSKSRESTKRNLLVSVSYSAKEFASPQYAMHRTLPYYDLVDLITSGF